MTSNATRATSQHSKSRIARFKDSLFINTTAANVQEQSAWSPLTPPSSSTPATTRNLFTRFSQAGPRSASSGSGQNDSHSSNTASSPPGPRPSQERMLKNAFGRLLRQPTSPTLPISRPILIGDSRAPNYNDLPSFGPLAPEKPRPNLTRPNQMDARRKKRRNVYIAAALIGATIIVVVVVLAVRLGKSGKDSGAPTGSSSPDSPSTSGLTSEQSKCLNDFTTSAPSAPLDYPVSCLKTLQSVSTGFITTDPTSADVIVAAKQFSALRLLFDGCSPAAQQGLNAGGWFKDTKLCAWTGVQCDGSGSIGRL